MTIPNLLLPSMCALQDYFWPVEYKSEKELKSTYQYILYHEIYIEP